MAVSAQSPAEILDAVWRAEGGRLLGGLARRLGDLDIAEDALQDAAAEALRAWPRTMPPNPAGWPATTAWRKAVDRLRRATTAQAKYARLAEEPPPAHGDEDLLALLFGCCDPALPEQARIPLTLRAACALSVDEIAAALLSSPAAVARPLTRAKARLHTAGVRFALPEPDQWAPRLPSVLACIYLLYNEGYLAARDDRARRPDLRAAALGLARELAALMPQEPEPAGLAALLELHQARAAPRFDEQGAMVLLERQDRARWDHALIAHAVRRLERAMAPGAVGPYQLQAAVAALHAQTPDLPSTDWRQIRLLYSRLHVLQPSPVVLLSRAVATRFALGPGQALAEVEAVSEEPAGYHLLHATRAELLADLGRTAEAIRRAHDVAVNPPSGTCSPAGSQNAPPARQAPRNRPVRGAPPRAALPLDDVLADWV